MEGNNHHLTIYIILDTCMNYSLLLDLYLLRYANIKLIKNNTVITRYKVETSEILEIFNIN